MIGPTGAGGEKHYIGIALEEKHYAYAGATIRAKG